MRFLIVGAGWYGCHAAMFLIKNGHQVHILDMQEDFFSGASSKNQNRLHLGFHYPRSIDTINECRTGFPLFMKTYGSFTFAIPKNLYFIHNESNIKSSDFLDLYETDFTNIDIHSLAFKTKNLEPTCINVQERFIDNQAIKQYFHNHLSDFFTVGKVDSFKMNDTTIIFDHKEYDYILNCTNNQWNPLLNNYNTIYEKYCTLLYHIDMPEITGITIMDGPFFSIYPYDISKNIYTVTHVKYGVLEKSRNVPDVSIDSKILEDVRSHIEKDISSILPDFLPRMTYKDYFISIKTKYDYISDDRSLRTFQKNRYISFSGGKITGIFSMEKILEQLIHST